MAQPLAKGSSPDAPVERSDSGVLTDVHKIRDQLKIFRNQRSELTIRFDGNAAPYRCKILDVLDDRLLLEDIAPRDGAAFLRKQIPFSISARTTGLFAFIDRTHATKADAERGVPYFHVPLPDRLLVQRRRRAARFRIPLTVRAAGASITLFRQGSDIGQIIDISVGGCRAEFEADVQPALAPDETIENCAIAIPRLLEIHSKGVIRHLTLNKQSNRWVCGIEFTEMHVTDRRRLEQFVQSLSRT